MLIIFLLYVPKRYFSDVNVGKLEESSRATLPFRRVWLWRHNHFKRETGRVACHPPPCGWQAGHSGQIVWITLWIWEKMNITHRLMPGGWSLNSLTNMHFQIIRMSLPRVFHKFPAYLFPDYCISSSANSTDVQRLFQRTLGRIAQIGSIYAPYNRSGPKPIELL